MMIAATIGRKVMMEEGSSCQCAPRIITQISKPTMPSTIAKA